MKKEMYAVYAYVMEWGNDFIPSEGSLTWFCKIKHTMAEDALALIITVIFFQRR